MTAPTSPPLVLTTDVATNYNFSAANAASSQRMLDAIVEASEWVEDMTRRYFVPRTEERYFKAYSYANGGDIDGSELWLDRDLQSSSPTITNGDGVAVTSGQYAIHPRNGKTKYIVQLLPMSGVYWTYTTNPEITVAATWCYGGQWKATGLTSSVVSSTTTTTLTVSAATILAGTILKIDSEVFYVETGGVVALTVERGYLGTTAATHTATQPVYRWESDALVQQTIKRMVGINKERDKSPIAGVASVGDFSTPFRVDKLAEDVRLNVTRLAFPMRIGGF